MKRLISALLVVMLVLSMLPVTTFAAGETYTKISSISELTTGTYVMVTAGYAPTVYNDRWVENTQPTITGDQVTDAKGAVWTITVNGSSATLKDSNGQFIKPNGSNTNGITTGEYSWTVACANETFTFAGSGVKLAANKTSSYKFRAYKDSTISGNTSGYPCNFTLYKLDDGNTGCVEHTPEVVTGTAATCTESGLTDGSICSVCKAVLTAQEEIPALGHNVVDGICQNCGEIMTMYDLVTDVAELTDGSQIIVVAAGYDKAMGAQSGNNCAAVDVAKAGTQVALDDTIQVLTVEEGTLANTYAFNTGSGYLYAASSSSNHLKIETEKDANASWAITIADGIATVKAQGTNTRNWMRYNDSSSIFSCYGSGQKDIAIYKLAGTGSEPVECSHPTSTVQDDAVAATCTTVGFTASEKCDTCGATTKFAEEIPALGHSYVDYACSVCMAIDPASPLTATRLSEAPANGDKIVVYHYSSKKIMSATFNTYGERLVGVDSAVADGKLPYGASAAVLTVIVTEAGEYAFQFADGKYLASAEAGNALVLADELDDLSLWTVTALEAGAFNIVNNGATYNGTDYNQALECYSGNFTTYGLQSTTAFQIDLYLVEAAVCVHTNTTEQADGKAATCTETGLTNSWTCDACGATVIAQEEIAALGHSYGSVYTAPTHMADGFTTYTCTVCGDSYVVTDENSKLELPKATVTEQDDVTLEQDEYRVWNGVVSDKESEALVAGEGKLPLEVVVNFQAQDTLEECLAGGFAQWLVDFNITVEGLTNGNFVADNCYLAGNYGSYGWIKIPLDGQTIEANIAYPVVALYDPTLNYKDICKSVKNFTAAIHIDQAILDANPSMTVKLELVMTNPNDANDTLQIGEDLIYNAEALKTPSVAKNENTGVTYTNVAEALREAAKGEKVTMLADYETTEEIYLRTGRTLDLNGKTLKASVVGAVNGANVIDSTNGNGKIVVDREYLALKQDNAHLPVWTDEGYRLTDVNFNQSTNRDGNKATLEFFFDDAEVVPMLAAEFVDGASDNNVTVQVKLSWVDQAGNSNIRYYAFKDDYVKLYASSWDTKMFYLNVTGIDNVSDLKIEAMLVTALTDSYNVIASAGSVSIA